MTMRTLIIDDEPIALEKLRKYVGLTPGLTLSAACADGFEAMEWLKDNDVDLIITDINMPDLNGLDFVKALSVQPLVIFTTAYPQYAVDGYKVSAVDYLLKPYGLADFSRAVGKATALWELHKKNTPQMSESLFVKVDYRYVRVQMPEIRFIKGYGEYLQIFIEGRANPLVTLSSFAAIRESLPDNFLQVHRSYIVNMDHVQLIERSRIVMDETNRIPVGESYKAAFQDYLSAHSIGKSGK